MAVSLTVIISAVVDHVWYLPRLPKPGESVKDARFQQFLGGKGANQAVQAARLGAQVTAVGCVGNDAGGRKFLDLFRDEGIDCERVRTINDQPTGTAGIYVGPNGTNTIAVDLGANMHITVDQLDGVPDGQVILSQLEVPIEVTRRASEIGRLLLNPAPPGEVPADILQKTWMLTPNETEAEYLAKIPVRERDSWSQVALNLHKRGPEQVVLTLGDKGSFGFDGNSYHHCPAERVQPVDTTGAGDSFTGALAVALAEGHQLPEAMRRAGQVAAISTTTPGAIPSLPRRDQCAWNG